MLITGFILSLTLSLTGTVVESSLPGVGRESSPGEDENDLLRKYRIEDDWDAGKTEADENTGNANALSILVPQVEENVCTPENVFPAMERDEDLISLTRIVK